MHYAAPSRSSHSARSRQRPHRGAIGVLGVALLLAPLLAPLPAQAEIRISLPSFFRIGPSTSIELNTASRQFRVKISGSILFNEAEDDVHSLSGKASIQERRDGRTRRMVFESESGGTIKRTYSVDGKAQALDADGRRWLAEMLPVVLRETAMDSERRIKRIHAAGGVDAVVAEIERIESGHARRRYVEGIAKLAPLDDRQQQRLLVVIAQMDSDFGKRNALSALAASQSLSAASQVDALRIVAAMDSSFEQRTVLTAMAPTLFADAGVAQAWLNAASKIDSDFELRSAIDVLVRRDPLPAVHLDAAIQATMKLDSDFEHASALVAIGRQMATATPAQVSSYLRSAQKIDSDFERRNVLTSFVSRNPLDKSGFLAVLQAIDGMDSDFEIRTVLAAVAKRMPDDSELINRYRRTARSLGDHERGQAEKALDRFTM